VEASLKLPYEVLKSKGQMGLAWVVKRRSYYPPYPSLNVTRDMSDPHGLIGLALYQQSHFFLST